LEKSRNSEARSVRNVDRTVKDLQAQIERREKSVTILSEDLSKSRDKVERLLQTIDELQASDSSSQLTAKRAERELREEREKSLRLERELEGFRGGGGGLRGSVARSERVAALSDYGGGSRRASSVRPPSVVGDVKIEVPQRQSSLMKGFL
jgi:myosin protein heavy chain